MIPGVLLVAVLSTLARRYRACAPIALDARLAAAERSSPRAALDEFAAILRTLEPDDVAVAAGTLSGDAWLHHLDRRFDTDWFIISPGRTSGDAFVASPPTFARSH